MSGAPPSTFLAVKRPLVSRPSRLILSVVRVNLSEPLKFYALHKDADLQREARSRKD